MTKFRKVKPCGFRVLVKLKKIKPQLEKKTEFGIVYDFSSEQKEEMKQKAHQEAYIMAIGPTAWKAFDEGQPWAKVGDLVQICKYAGDDIRNVEEDETYRLLNDRDIQCIFEGEGL